MIRSTSAAGTPAEASAARLASAARSLEACDGSAIVRCGWPFGLGSNRPRVSFAFAGWSLVRIFAGGCLPVPRWPAKIPGRRLRRAGGAEAQHEPVQNLVPDLLCGALDSARESE